MMRKIALALVFVMIMSMFSGLAFAQTAEYTGSARGFGGMVEVTLTVTDGKITACTIVGNDETVGIGSRAIDELPAKIVEAGSVEVDAVAGATVTSAAIKAAASAALAQAEGTNAAAAMTPGTYRATAKGFANDVVIDVTVDETSILAIDVVQSHESGYIGDDALILNAQKMIEHQSLMIDEVSGATFSSTALFNGVSDALTQAGANLNDFMTDYRTPARELTNPAEFPADIVVVGAGVSGMTAAMNAARFGLKVMVFEQLDRIGGACTHAGGALMGAGSDLQYVFGIDDDPEAFYQYLLETCNTNDAFNPEVVKAFAYESGATTDQFTDWGYVFRGFNSVASNTAHANQNVPRYSGPIAGTGRGRYVVETLSVPFYRYMDNGYIGLQLNSQVTDLIQEDGAVVGVVVTDKKDGSTYEYRAPITIVAAGGYGNGGALLKETFDRIASSASTGSLGNMIEPVKRVGGVLTGVGTDHAFPGMLDTTDSGSIQVKYEVNYTNPGYVWVDKNAKRIVNEATADSAERTGTWNKAENNTVYMLLNEDIMALTESTVLNFGGYACALPDKGNQALAMLAEEGKLVWKADTIREVAEMGGLDPAALEATVERYNGFCETGVDEDFGRTANLVKLEKGPFYLIETIPSSMSTNAGFDVDTKMHVLNAEGEPIPGLFASGEFVGSSTLYGDKSFPGGGIGQGAVLGRIAGINAARETILAQ